LQKIPLIGPALLWHGKTADKVNITLVRIGLLNQGNHEADDETILFRDKAGRAKMNEKQLGSICAIRVARRIALH